MAFSQSDLDALDAAIAAGRGARQITFNDGQTVAFNSIAEMLSLRAIMKREIDETSSPAYRLAVTSKGT